MNQRSSRLDLKLLKKVFAFVIILCVVNVFLVLLWSVRFGDLLFIEGGIIFAAGAYVAAGAGNLKRESPRTLFADPEGHARFLREQRKKQYANGGLIMIVGAIIIAVSIVFSMI